MQELNRAWAVLRNPALRAAYDDTLAPPEVVLAPAARPRISPAGDVSKLVAPAPIGSAVTREERENAGDDAGNGCVVALVVAGVAITATVVIAVVAVLLTSNTTPASVQVRTQDRFDVGTCVLVRPSDGSPEPGSASVTGSASALGADGEVVVDEVPCTGTGPRSGKVTSRVKLPLPCPRDTAAVVLADQEVSLCVAAS